MTKQTVEPGGELEQRKPERVVMTGRFACLEPLQAAKHGDALWQAAGGSENSALWTYLFEGPFVDRSEFNASLAAKEKSSDPLFFSVVLRKTGEARGYASLMRVEPAHRVIEVGNILYSASLQQTAAATEAMYLLARYVFEDLRYRRYEWKCNALNTPSRRAALRLGFRYEGTFRQHMIVKGQNRDTAWFSMLDSEWPERKQALERWLDPANFDPEGRQLTPLSRPHS